MGEQCESQQMLAVFEPLSSVNLEGILNIKVLIREIRRGCCVLSSQEPSILNRVKKQHTHPRLAIPK